MRVRLLVILILILLVTPFLCFGETLNPPGSGSGQKAVSEEKPAGKAAPKVEIYVTDW